MNVRPAAARLVCRLWLRVALISSAVRRKPVERAPLEPLTIAALGPMAGANWVDAYMRPILAADSRAVVTVFSSLPIRPDPRVRVITPPNSAVRLFGGAIARALWTGAWILRHRPQIVMGLHLPWNGIFGLLLARLIGAQAWYFCVGGAEEFLDGGVHSEHAIFVATGRPDPRREQRMIELINRFDRVLTMGTSTRAALKRHGVTLPIEPVGVGIDVQRFRRHSRAVTRTVDVIAVARLAPIKRLEVLLHALALLEERRGSALRATIVGAGPELKRLKALAQRLQIADNVHFAGWCEDVERWLHQARVFVLASRSEGLPISMLEAMACGVPCVAPRIGDVEDAVSHERSGIVVGQGTAEEIAAGIDAVLSLSQNDYAQMSRAAAADAARFSVETKRQHWIELLGAAPRAIATMTSTRAPTG